MTAFILAGSAVSAIQAQSRATQQRGSPEARAHLTIPFLANATKPSDLDFLAAQCDVDTDGARMTCRFRQLFLTVSSIDPQSCVVTANGYERTFRREADRRWVSDTPPEGDCGLVETTTLDDGGGTRWTLTLRTTATRGQNRAACVAFAAEPEVYDWRTMKRHLPCTTVQPGAIER